MYLSVDNYKFPMIIHKYDFEEDITVQVGNPKCKPKPCLQITLNPSEYLAGIDTMRFYTTCSISEKAFQRGTGATHIMVKATLKLLIEKYPSLKVFALADKSYFDTEDGNTLMLPEKMALTEGVTWYEKHFQAVPDDATSLVLKKYKRAYAKYGDMFRKLPLDAWYSQNIQETLRKAGPMLENVQLSGMQWFIHRDVIQKYDVPDFKVVMEGGGSGIKRFEELMTNIPWKTTPRVW